MPKYGEVTNIFSKNSFHKQIGIAWFTKSSCSKRFVIFISETAGALVPHPPVKIHYPRAADRKNTTAQPRPGYGRTLSLQALFPLKKLVDVPTHKSF